MSPNPTVFRNRLLAALTRTELAVLQPLLQFAELPLRLDCEVPNTPIRDVYFPESGVASVVAKGNGNLVEVGLIGREGMTGLMVVMGNDRSPHHTYVQIAGDGHRISAANLRVAMRDQPSLRELFLCYGQSFLIQTAHTALANGKSSLEGRLARWLLLADDRIDGSDLPLVHEFMALMLGVHRPGVTLAM